MPWPVFWRVGIHRFHQYDTSIFQCSFSRLRLEASTKEITPIAACSTFSAAQAVQQSPPAAKACFQSQSCTTVPLKYMNQLAQRLWLQQCTRTVFSNFTLMTHMFQESQSSLAQQMVANATAAAASMCLGRDLVDVLLVLAWTSTAAKHDFACKRLPSG